MVKIEKYYADWCQPCKALSHELSKVDLSDFNAELEEVNIEEQAERARAAGIRSIPTTIIKKDDEVVTVFGGVHSAEEIRNLLQEAIHGP